MKREDIAMIAHEVNRAYCEALGDDSQPPWEKAPDWQKQSASNGVDFHINNPDAGPEASHESWLAEKEADGWVFGREKKPSKKEHPCMVQFDALPVEAQAKDHIFRAVVHACRPLLAALVLMVLLAGCGTTNSQGPLERIGSAFGRGFGTTGSSLDAGLVLTSPTAASDESLEQEVLLYSPMRGAVTVVRFSAGDTQKVRASVNVGTLLTVTGGSPLLTDGGRQVVQAGSWKADNSLPAAAQDALFRDLPVVLKAIAPKLLASVVTEPVVATAAAIPAAPVVEYRESPYCRVLLEAYHAGVVSDRWGLEQAGYPRSEIKGLYADTAVINYLKENAP